MPGIAALRVSNRANSVRYTSLTAFRSLSNLRKLSGMQALDARQEAVSRCSQQQQTNACTLYNFEKSKMSGSRRTYRTLPLDVPHSPAERIALSRRTSRTLPREVPHSVLHSPAERPSKIDAYFVACAYSKMRKQARPARNPLPGPDSGLTSGQQPPRSPAAHPRAAASDMRLESPGTSSDTYEEAERVRFTVKDEDPHMYEEAERVRFKVKDEDLSPSLRDARRQPETRGPPSRSPAGRQQGGFNGPVRHDEGGGASDNVQEDQKTSSHGDKYPAGGASGRSIEPLQPGRWAGPRLCSVIGRRAVCLGLPAMLRTCRFYGNVAWELTVPAAWRRKCIDS
ncbi:hypothetical protein Bbelb_401470 [Branchiostoma belcheri]|nr:hypothetical protein Bbelb_401470 [Branchiostoma belcheri]